MIILFKLTYTSSTVTCMPSYILLGKILKGTRPERKKKNLSGVERKGGMCSLRTLLEWAGEDDLMLASLASM